MLPRESYLKPPFKKAKAYLVYMVFFMPDLYGWKYGPPIKAINHDPTSYFYFLSNYHNFR